MSTQFGMTRRRSACAPFSCKLVAHRVADRDDTVGTLQVERDETAQKRHDNGILEALELHGHLWKDVLADHDERRAITPRHEQGDVGDDRRIGHAEHDVRARTAQPPEERVPEVRDVVGATSEELRALERRGGHAHDLDAVVDQPPRLVLVAVQDPRHDLHVDVLCKRLAQLGQQLRRRLDARPVVLVQNEKARSRHPRKASLPK